MTTAERRPVSEGDCRAGSADWGKIPVKCRRTAMSTQYSRSLLCKKLTENEYKAALSLSFCFFLCVVLTYDSYHVSHRPARKQTLFLGLRKIVTVPCQKSSWFVHPFIPLAPPNPNQTFMPSSYGDVSEDNARLKVQGDWIQASREVHVPFCPRFCRITAWKEGKIYAKHTQRVWKRSPRRRGILFYRVSCT